MTDYHTKLNHKLYAKWYKESSPKIAAFFLEEEPKHSNFLSTNRGTEEHFE